MAFKTFTVDGTKFQAEDCIQGVLVNPKLSKNFDNTPNEERPASHEKWWYRPFIKTETVESHDAFYAGRTDAYAEAGREHWKEGRKQWMKAYPSGTRYDVRCLDGGAWDRSTGWGMYGTLDEALNCAKQKPIRW